MGNLFEGKNIVEYLQKNLPKSIPYGRKMTAKGVFFYDSSKYSYHIDCIVSIRVKSPE